jgi:hypothetical protein
MSNLDFYLLFDHAARRRTMYFSVAAGAVVGASAELFGASFEHAAIASVLTVGLVEILTAVRYVEPDRKAQRDIVAFPIRRRLIHAAVSSAVVLVVALLRLPRAEARIVERKLTQASQNPGNPQNIKEVKAVLDRSKNAGIKITPSVVEDTGKKFLEAAKDDPEAWDAALAFVDYRSSLNGPDPTPAGFYPFGYLETPTHETTHYQWGRPFDKALPEFTTSLLRAPIAKAARFEQIGANLPQEAHMGPAFLLGRGGDMVLDTFYLRNIVLDGVTVHYNGGPLVLDNVTFLNCRFVVDNVDNGRALGYQLLASSTVTFRIPPA